MIDEKTLKEQIERVALLKNRIFKRIVSEYKPTYDILFYIARELTPRQSRKLYTIAYKLMKRDLKKIAKIESAARSEIDFESESEKGNE